MGNLGRAGYGGKPYFLLLFAFVFHRPRDLILVPLRCCSDNTGTLEGMWPYSYDSCDVGTLANQTLDGLPSIATTSGPEGDPGNGALSFLPGQRLSACTCPNDLTHPGPRYSDGSFMGRSAPEVQFPSFHLSLAAGGIMLTESTCLIVGRLQIDIIEAQGQPSMSECAT